MKLWVAVLGILLFARADASDWSAAGYLGMTHSGSTTATATVQGTSFTASTGSLSSLNFGVEVFQHTESLVHFALIGENSWYALEGEPSDHITSFMVAPRIQTGTPLNLWAELGAGVAITRLGNQSGTVSGVSATYDSRSHVSLALSPRVGVDVQLNERFFMGLHASYFATKATLHGTAISGMGSAPFTTEYSRHFFTTVIRIGWNGSRAPAAPATASEPVPPMPRE